jgi:hypothetical protein
MGWQMTEATKERMRQAKLGKPRKPFTEAHRLALSLSVTQAMANTELRARIGAGVSAAARRRKEAKATANTAPALPSAAPPPRQPRIIPVEEMTPQEVQRWIETGIHPMR